MKEKNYFNSNNEIKFRIKGGLVSSPPIMDAAGT